MGHLGVLFCAVQGPASPAHLSRGSVLQTSHSELPASTGSVRLAPFLLPEPRSALHQLDVQSLASTGPARVPVGPGVASSVQSSPEEASLLCNAPEQLKPVTLWLRQGVLSSFSVAWSPQLSPLQDLGLVR